MKIFVKFYILPFALSIMFSCVQKLNNGQIHCGAGQSSGSGGGTYQGGGGDFGGGGATSSF